MVIERQEPITFNVYDGHLICIKKDNDLNFYNIERPEVKVNELTQ